MLKRRDEEANKIVEFGNCGMGKQFSEHKKKQIKLEGFLMLQLEFAFVSLDLSYQHILLLVLQALHLAPLLDSFSQAPLTSCFTPSS